MSEEATVVVRRVFKNYEVPNLKGRNPFRKDRSSTVSALKGVSLVANRGDSIGVLGRNGSGKSTLLRLIAGGESSSSGDIFVTSNPTLLSVSAALQPSLTGVENIHLGLLAQGLSPSEARGLENEIIRFSGIGDAVHRPMNTYSSGMGARLKFAISTSVRREILLVDEALSTGDAAFGEKARKRMFSFLDDAGTIFLVSHQASTIQKICNRVIWLHEGEIIADGDPIFVSKMYRSWSSWLSQEEDEKAEAIIAKMRSKYVTPHIVFTSEAEEVLNFSS
ncbi:ABC transporter ATP-binding protein [Corynebacterium suedekumii]|uniref:ABC transporter ATP-binding protein n=1 Tax=Corynebacterium suedekumii TaxID=3049801 RepID=A0ABY8VPU0_9CORY|nr:ABC transporter ATP-binding protein [Corynebacterium suedekumii]WIM70203.1 ABC transporter ATP-binding protein [Corynebacterium suedekumii]